MVAVILSVFRTCAPTSHCILLFPFYCILQSETKKSIQPHPSAWLYGYLQFPGCENIQLLCLKIHFLFQRTSFCFWFKSILSIFWSNFLDPSDMKILSKHHFLCFACLTCRAKRAFSVFLSTRLTPHSVLPVSSDVGHREHGREAGDV